MTTQEDGHPSHVMVGFARCGGSPGKLFGSHLKEHHGYVLLKVSKARLEHDLGADVYHASLSGDLLEVMLSAAQFSELLTTMNIGSGVPGTLSRYNNKAVPQDLGEPTRESDRIRAGFRQSMRKLAENAKREALNISELLEKKGPLTVSDRLAVRQSVSSFFQEIVANVPHAMDMFEETSSKVVTAAKAEIDAFVTHAIVTEGLKSLATRGEGPARLPVAPAVVEAAGRGLEGDEACEGVEVREPRTCRNVDLRLYMARLAETTRLADHQVRYWVDRNVRLFGSVRDQSVEVLQAIRAMTTVDVSSDADEVVRIPIRSRREGSEDRLVVSLTQTSMLFAAAMRDCGFDVSLVGYPHSGSDNVMDVGVLVREAGPSHETTLLVSPLRLADGVEECIEVQPFSVGWLLPPTAACMCRVGKE